MTFLAIPAETLRLVSHKSEKLADSGEVRSNEKDECEELLGSAISTFYIESSSQAHEVLNR